MKKLFLIFILLLKLNCHAQSFFEKDTSFNASRTAWTSGAIAGGWTGSILALKNVWYKDSWTNEFHTFDDSKQWLGMDKIGHFYTGNLITKNITSTYKWSGLNRNQSLLIGSSVAFGYLTSLEVLDGYSKDWGFSWSDISANTAGIFWYVWQDLLWQEQRMKIKFSAHLSPYAKYRPNVLGGTVAERLLKDYNGQSYWLSITPSQFLSNSSNFPKWLSFSFGYSIDEKIYGNFNQFFFAPNQKPLNAKSQYLFSLDIDFEQFNPKRKWVKTLFKVINHVKVPFPAVIFNGERFEVSPLYF
ncbi:DUF2279 domain-containing protein [Brumimicrobium aurantiacum]|uniref:DUF2279 domain-containing protein n=1 Tax=Brumimicrobium aurantiacum TaxID=1737063 RepID=A0A3E1EW11_9FLAO|nr:DUF2279 domain-containing protein [Brumimicrobium aurantiacum]RFC53745.1 DUF2279 domain-containing protein [Brumimicrobium aurantiacum]